MGEDAQVEASDDDRALSPVLDGTLKHEEWQDRWICSIDGSYAVGKERSRSKQEELAPCSEYGSVQEMAVEHVISKDSLLMLTGMVVDDSQPVARKSRSVLCGNEFSSIIQLPQSLEMPMKQERLSRPRSDQRDQARISRGMSPIQFNADVQGHARLTSRASQIYDPLRRIVSQASLANDSRFSSELQAQGDKLMNGLRAILNEKLAKGKAPCSSAPSTVTTALSRAGSESTVSTGRDILTKEVRKLENAFGEFNIAVGAGRRHGGGDSYPPVKEEMIASTFSMPDLISQERPCSGSSGILTVEQARQSSRGSVQVLTENAIRDAESSSRILRRLGSAPNQLPTKLLREQSTNTSKDPVRHLVITHRVKHADCCLGRNRMHSEPFASDLKPLYHQFKLRPTADDCQQVFGSDPIASSSKHLYTQTTDGETERPIIKISDWESTARRTEKFCRKTGGGKRGRPIVAGRTLYGRGRVHFRPPVARHDEPCRKRDVITISSVEKISPVLQDAATSTEREALETDVEVVTKNEVVHDEPECSLPEQPKQKSARQQKIPFVGSGLKCSNTFSLVGNQQQVMKIVSIRFQEWLPLVRSIIYDSQCKDYAQAFLRELRRQKRSNLEQIRILERDLNSCNIDSERREIYADITRLKQQWTRKHERVFRCLGEHISKGGVYSKVQQLRTIYGACAA